MKQTIIFVTNILFNSIKQARAQVTVIKLSSAQKSMLFITPQEEVHS